MATIRKRNDSYQAIVRKSGHPAVTKTFTSKRKAQAWAAGVESRIDEGEEFDTRRYMLADAIDRYSNDPNRELATNKKTILNWWKTKARNHAGVLLGKKRLQNLRRSDFFEARDLLRAEKKHLRKPTDACKDNACDCPRLAPATVNRRMAAISAVVTEAQQWDWIKENVARIKGLDGEVERERLLTPDEQDRLLKACKASAERHMYVFTVCAMLSGARAGELQALRWRDVDLDKGMARLLNTKNGRIDRHQSGATHWNSYVRSANNSTR